MSYESIIRIGYLSKNDYRANLRNPTVRISLETDLLGDVLNGEEGRKGWGLDFMGVPLLVYDLRRISEIAGAVREVELASGLLGAAKILEGEFGEASVKVVDGWDGQRADSAMTIPSNGVVVGDGDGRWGFEALSEPWNLLGAMARSLREEVTETRISDSAEIASTAVISGPCVISEGVMIDDFCKIKGPAFIGAGTKVWTGSLVRESMIGPNCEVGFGCEIGRTYMLGGDRTAHHDVILDSVLGLNVWMGAFIGTTNKLLTNANVRYKRGEGLVDTGTKHFGAVFGHHSSLGAGTVLLPGRFVPPRAIIQAGTVYSGPADVKQ